MGKWFVRYKSGLGYIAARETEDGNTEYYGEYKKDRESCQKIVNGLNYGFLKP